MVRGRGGMQYVQWTISLWKEVMRYLKKKTGPKPNILNRYPEIKKQGNNIFYKRKQIIPEPGISTVLREQMYGKNSDAPIGRDSLHKYIQERFWGISRRAVMKFLQAQPSYQMLSRRPSKQKGANANFFQSIKGTVGVDLVYLGKESFPPGFLKRPKKKALDKKTNHYVLTMVDSLTHYGFAMFIGTGKESWRAVDGYNNLAEEYKRVFGYYPKIVVSDRGDEFTGYDFALMVKEKKLGRQFVKLVPYVEQFNGQLQKYMVILATGMRVSKNVETIIKLSLKRANNGIHVRMRKPIRECVAFLKSEPKKYMLQWSRGKRSTKPAKNRRTFKKGDHVRYWQGPDKGGFYKRYNGLTEMRSKDLDRVTGSKARANWSKKVYIVDKVMTRYGKQYLRLTQNPPRVQKILDLSNLSQAEIDRYKRHKRKPPKVDRKKFIPADEFLFVMPLDVKSVKMVRRRAREL